jgi:hypothetical protein
MDRVKQCCQWREDEGWEERDGGNKEILPASDGI